MKGLQLLVAFAALLIGADGVAMASKTSLRESVTAKTLGRQRGALTGTYYPPEDSLVYLEAGGSPGAKITEATPVAAVLPQNKCYIQGADSNIAILQPYVTKVPGHKRFAFGCTLNIQYPNAKSGDCTCTLMFVAVQEFGPEGDWIGGYDMSWDCGNNACAKIPGDMPGKWNMNEMSNTITFVPADPTPKYQDTVYDGDVEARWSIAGSGGQITITESTSYTDSRSKELAQSNSLKVSIGDISFGGAKLGAEYTNAVTSKITTTISTTSTHEKKCTTKQCDDNIYQGIFQIYTKDRAHSITVETCIFKCAKTMPDFAPGKDQTSK